jgi:hypothetical protein
MPGQYLEQGITASFQILFYSVVTIHPSTDALTYHTIATVQKFRQTHAKVLEFFQNRKAKN